MSANGEASSVRLNDEISGQDNRKTSLANLVSAALQNDSSETEAGSGSPPRGSQGSQFPTSNSRSSDASKQGLPAPPPLVSFPPSQLPGGSKASTGFPPLLPTPYTRGSAGSAGATTDSEAQPNKYPYNLYYSRPRNGDSASSSAVNSTNEVSSDPIFSHLRGHKADGKDVDSSSESDSGESDAETSKPEADTTADASSQRGSAAKKQRVGQKPQPPKPSEERPYRCVNGCPWSFSRLSDLRRHMKSHDTPQFHCPFWDNDNSCHRSDGSFNRLDVLKRHLRLVHFVPEGGIKSAKQNGKGWCKGCHEKFATNKEFINHCLECGKTANNATDWKPDVSKGEPVLPGYDFKGARIPNLKRKRDDYADEAPDPAEYLKSEPVSNTEGVTTAPPAAAAPAPTASATAEKA
ncbi:unnamed protein product [Kuraishia capsulata CBS 1993]|uniref:C2H2-type domain-containing protein n=1 Tax=Kuraishia capsulata CBS 1993 TaxID=1382522 RepID=W6MPA8_9ASCO|nr:uncharacterized protein KUCA_T00004109001 [Kuraishia capsulata CBS 1993]CDK28128.1 unnamed protein product [Kuraishia capsulata CBS 1993]